MGIFPAGISSTTTRLIGVAEPAWVTSDARRAKPSMDELLNDGNGHAAEKILHIIDAAGG